MMSKPLIGITVAHVAEELQTFPRAYYVESVKKAKGTPLLIPPVADQEEAKAVFSRVDGLILSGGGDIAPLYLGELAKRCIGDCQPERDVSEILLAQWALQHDRPLLGICRGMQVMAIAAQGKIHQDIFSQYPEAMEHRQRAPRSYPWHEIEILEDTRLRAILRAPEKSITVNSFHHQAVFGAPPGFRINAVAPDGIVEGIEKARSGFCLGVQWHPESMEQDVYAQRLFVGLIQACR
ncbi:MAG: gamma-glutamyl-gamma-aminobutyrate hydrolase family protein [Peptococcaceae bacterium]|jgi:putative glutamine amidotransferase|nr:gamma-glutamyl-gamma-aminobutyrate hydrolase family protein [Peptococcaceae bacterium]